MLNVMHVSDGGQAGVFMAAHQLNQTVDAWGGERGHDCADIIEPKLNACNHLWKMENDFMWWKPKEYECVQTFL